MIGWGRRNLLVPVLRAASMAALNEQLLERCRRRFGDRCVVTQKRSAKDWREDLPAFHDLPSRQPLPPIKRAREGRVGEDF